MKYGPIAIGGVGGSGTRIVANIIAQSGIFIGNDLNDSLDNLSFSYLFIHYDIFISSDRKFSEIYKCFRNSMTGGASTADFVECDRLLSYLARCNRPFPARGSDWVAERHSQLRNSLGSSPIQGQQWGWKVPNTHMIIDRLAAIEPTLRYIHVVRNGMDMAFSANQNQLHAWGPMALGPLYEAPMSEPARSLAFWCWAHRRIQKIGAQLGSRFLMINFDTLCLAPEEGIRNILDFVGVRTSDENIASLGNAIAIPETSGRANSKDITQFNKDDIEFVRSVGFIVN